MGKVEDKPVPDAGRSPDCVVIGAGPAGLTAALEFIRHGRVPLVLEKDSSVGGVARTESYQGFRFDRGDTASSPSRTRSTGCGKTCSARSSCCDGGFRGSSTGVGSSPIRRSCGTPW